MTVWDIRQKLEQSMPWWILPIIFGGAIAFFVLTNWWMSKPRTFFKGWMK